MDAPSTPRPKLHRDQLLLVLFLVLLPELLLGFTWFARPDIYAQELARAGRTLVAIDAVGIAIAWLGAAVAGWVLLKVNARATGSRRTLLSVITSVGALVVVGGLSAGLVLFGPIYLQFTLGVG